MQYGNLNIRIAGPDDVDVVASIMTTVSEGVIEHLLGGVFPGMSAQKVLAMILSRGSGNIDLKNVLLVEVDHQLAGLLYSYDAKEQTVSSIMEGFLGKSKLDPMRPLLEAKVDNALWINTLWVHENFRGQGLAQLVVSLAEDLARDAGFQCLALHCWADNLRAKRFYEGLQFKRQGVIDTALKLKARHLEAGELWVKQITQRI